MLGSKIAWDDTILPFQLDNSDVRGRCVRLDGVLNSILSQHDYPAEIEALVAEVALLTALIGQTIKLRWKLSLQVRGNGAARLIATDFIAPAQDGEPATMRAYASFDEEKLKTAQDFGDIIGNGYFAILIDQGEGTTPYQGITPLAGTSISACAETYFAQSEQLPTKFVTSFGKSTLAGEQEGWRAGGIMVQKMPAASPLHTPEGDPEGAPALLSASDLLDASDEEDWSRVGILLESVEDLELIGPSLPPTDLLVRLFHEEQPRVFDAQPVRFGCSCSEDRVRQSLSIYSKKDIAQMTTDEGTVTADCQFCGAHYVLMPDELGFEGTQNNGSSAT